MVCLLRGLKREGQIESSFSLLDYWSEQILAYPMPVTTTPTLTTLRLKAEVRPIVFMAPLVSAADKLDYSSNVLCDILVVTTIDGTWCSSENIRLLVILLLAFQFP
jgi:hypothetical protein